MSLETITKQRQRCQSRVSKQELSGIEWWSDCSAAVEYLPSLIHVYIVLVYSPCLILALLLLLFIWNNFRITSFEAILVNNYSYEKHFLYLFWIIV